MIFHSPSDEDLKREVSFYENEWINRDVNTRCEKCYACRMDATAQYAAENGFDSFSTTLLLSIYQNHDLIKKTAMEAAEKYNIKFYYRDFREGFKESQTLAKEDGIYRQKHCGCIISLNTSALKTKIYANSP
jgi:predicted adenine nucleotide alpha hydrolase (AANH) superfamily ATPase